MKRFLAVSLVVLTLFCVAAGMAFGGGRADGGRDERIQIEFWTLSLQPTFTGFIQSLIDKYEAGHPNIRIYWQDLPWDGIQDKFLTTTAGGNPPDVVNIWSQLALTYAGKGALLDLEANASPAQKSIYLEAAYNSARLGNGVYAFPWYATPNISVYNKELLAQGGLSKPPATFDEAFTMAVDFRAKTGAYLLTPPSMFHVFYNYGIPMVSADKKRAAFNTPEAVALVTRLRDLGRAGAFNTEPGSWDNWDGDRQLYATGKLAMVLGGPQTVTRIKDEAPAMLAKTGVGPAVMGPAKISGEAIMNMVISKASKHPKEAIDFANFITNDENQLAFCHIVSIFPTTKIAAADPFFQSDMESLEGQANYYASISAQDAVDMTLGLENDENVKQEIDNITDAIFATGTDPAQAIANAETRVNELLAQNSN
ncbi:MAG: sugar ABC transporter substrate-binding protein [Treponema sp.]|jgi:putative chitobiose transport system substrate-binding protein|nr:sugar ABC transporter substrate-binding protein [Treponema sp.]